MKSKDKAVQKFLAELKVVDAVKYKIVSTLRKKVFEIVAPENERIMYGGIMFTKGEDFGGLFVSKNHVSFEFSKGNTFTDPNNVLEGTGKYRRHLKFKKASDLEEKDVEVFLKQIA